MSRLVIDASVTAAWLLDDEFDPRAAIALDWLRQDGAIVPQLWQFEIRNVLLVAERRGRVPMNGNLERLDALGALPIVTDHEADFLAVFGLARKHDLSFYDAMYLELAKRRVTALATLDSRLASATLAEGLEVPSG